MDPYGTQAYGDIWHVYTAQAIHDHDGIGKQSRMLSESAGHSSTAQVHIDSSPNVVLCVAWWYLAWHPRLQIAIIMAILH